MPGPNLRWPELWRARMRALPHRIIVKTFRARPRTYKGARRIANEGGHAHTQTNKKTDRQTHTHKRKCPIGHPHADRAETSQRQCAHESFVHRAPLPFSPVSPANFPARHHPPAQAKPCPPCTNRVKRPYSHHICFPLESMRLSLGQTHERARNVYHHS